jgi:hypothetical protein
MTSPPPSLSRRKPLFDSVAVQKALAALVITFCLSVQLYAIVRQSGVRRWPFVDYPMFSQSYAVGATFQMLELRARTCAETPQEWKVEPRTLGYFRWVYWSRLKEIIEDRPRAGEYRSDMSRFVGVRAALRPCALQVWERAVTITRNGVDTSALRNSRWTPLVEWQVDDPDSVRVLTPRRGTPQ